MRVPWPMKEMVRSPAAVGNDVFLDLVLGKEWWGWGEGQENEKQKQNSPLHFVTPCWAVVCCASIFCPFSEKTTPEPPWRQVFNLAKQIPCQKKSPANAGLFCHLGF